jgi:hypothetical protein
VLRHLPLKYSAIYYVTRLSDEQLRLGIKTGIINREATRGDIKSFRDNSLPSDQPTHEKSPTSQSKGSGKTAAQDKTKRKATKQEDQMDEEGFDEDSFVKMLLEGNEPDHDEPGNDEPDDDEPDDDEPTEQHDVTFEDLKHRWDHKGVLNYFDWTRTSKKDRERFKAEVLR